MKDICAHSLAAFLVMVVPTAWALSPAKVIVHEQAPAAATAAHLTNPATAHFPVTFDTPLPSAGIPVLPGNPAGTPALIQSHFGSQGNFELIVPASDVGMIHYWRDNDDPERPWRGPYPFGRNAGHIDSVSFIQSNYGNPGNLELIAKSGDRLLYFWRNSGPNLTWMGPYQIATGAAGAPSLIQSRFGSKGNFELVVPSASGGIDHYWRNNDDSRMPWIGPIRVAPGSGYYDGVSIIHSNYGNLEMVARQGSRLAYFWRTNDGAKPWAGPYFIGDGLSGNPIFIQSNYGSKGNFELLAPSRSGGIDFYWRNNDDSKMPWAGPFNILHDAGAVNALSFIQSNYGRPGNLEVVSTAGDRIDFAFRDGLTWKGPYPLAAPVEVPAPPATPPDLHKSYTETMGQLVSRPGSGAINDLTRTGIYGTDLGSSFEYNGLLVFLFGDSWTVSGVGFNDDSMAWTNAARPARFAIPRLNWVGEPGPLQPLRAGSISLGGMEVPVEGFAVGSRLYTFFVTGWHEGANGQQGWYDRSVLAHRDDLNGATFTVDHDVSTGRFLNISAVQASDGYLYLYGAGNRYRESSVRLARVLPSQVADRKAWTYYRGQRGGRPIFGPWESSAADLIFSPCVGEFSVRKHAASGLYLMAYNCGNQPPGRGIHFRTARTPWGPWSQAELLSDVSANDGGYMVTMHRNRSDQLRSDGTHIGVGFDDGLADPFHLGKKEDGDTDGGEYGPYFVSRWFQTLGGGAYSVPWVLSSWNPYKVTLMDSVLVKNGVNWPKPVRGTALPRAALANPDWTQGMHGWQLSGGPFVTFPKNGRTYMSTYNAAAGGDATRGSACQNLTIDSQTRELAFSVHGGHASVRLYHRGAIVRDTWGLDSNSRELQAVWQLWPYAGESVRLCIEDTLNEPWGFVSVSPFVLK